MKREDSLDGQETIKMLCAPTNSRQSSANDNDKSKNYCCKSSKKNQVKKYLVFSIITPMKDNAIGNDGNNMAP